MIIEGRKERRRKVKKKKMLRKGLLFLLVLALQTTPAAYASEASNEAGNKEGESVPGSDARTGQQENGQDVTDTKDPAQVQTGEDSQDPQQKTGETGDLDTLGEGTQDPAQTGDKETEDSVQTEDETKDPEEDTDNQDPEEDPDVQDPEEDPIPGVNGTPGWCSQGEDWYYYDPSGVKASGWRRVNGAWYYLDGSNEEKPGIMLKSAKQAIGGAVYFFDGSGAMLTGWIRREEGWYYAYESGAMATSWLLSGRTWYYLDGSNEEYPGLMLADCGKDIGGAKYFFDGSGAMPTGWVLRPEGWYYTNGSGAMVTGWQWLGGAWYYLDAANAEYPGLMVSDFSKAIGGQTYFFYGSGAMRTGWIQQGEEWYYANGSGAMATGWLYLGGLWYYLDGANEEHPGMMLRNCEAEIGGQAYVFTGSGAMRAGWVQEADGSWYYYDTTYGRKVTGWQSVGGTWYYLDPAADGKMACGGWQNIGGVWYFLYGNGAMATNWLSTGGAWYYLGGDGAMKTGWQAIGGNWYYFYKENDPNGGVHGMMAANTTIDGYRLQADGAWLTGPQAEMSMKAQAYGSSTGYLILVDRAACKVGIFTGHAGAWTMQNFWDCAPGTAATPTVSGTFKIQSRGYYFDSGASRCYWYTQFHGNYLFHSVLYNKNGTLMDGRVGIPLSHGCVRLVIDNAKWIYDNIPSGTTVVVY